MIATTTTALLDEALRLASLGYRVFPLRPGSKVPLPGTHGVHEATTDSSIIEAWWSSNPHANIGLAMGCGVAALDLDPGAIQTYGFDSIGELELGMAAYPRQSTPRGGWHWFVREPVNAQWRNSVGKVGSGLDVKTDGGYVVVAPSRVLDPAKKIDGAYEWLEPLPDDMRDIPLAPQWLAKAIEEAAASKPATAHTAVEPVPASEQTLRRAAAYARSISPAVQGRHGHASLLWAATSLVRGFRLTDADAMRILCDEYNPRCNPPWEGDELDREFAHKISDARTKPFSKPAGWLLDPEHAYGDGMTDAEVEKFTGRSPSENGSSVRPELSAADSEDSPSRSRPAEAPGGAEAPPLAGAPAIVRMADVTPEKVGWLWPKRIPMGKLTIVAGDPGLGKSYMVLDLMARVSRGFAWPDSPMSRAPVGGGVVLTCEDGLADTIRPRLDTLGADCSKIVAMRGVHRGDGKVDHFTLDDVEPLRKAIGMVDDCKVVMIDALSGYLGGADSHNNAETRAVLADLALLAEETGVAMIGVSHLSKSGVQAKRSAYRVMGSLAFVAAPRAVWAVGVDPADDDRRIIASVKMNIAKPAPSWAYRIDDAGLHWEATACGIDCDTALGGDAGAQEHPAQDDAEAFLLAELADGPVPVNELLDRAKNAGHKDGMLRKAKKNLGVVAQKRGMNGGWVWVDSAVEISRHVEGDPEDVQGAPV